MIQNYFDLGDSCWGPRQTPLTWSKRVPNWDVRAVLHSYDISYCTGRCVIYCLYKLEMIFIYFAAGNYQNLILTAWLPKSFCHVNWKREENISPPSQYHRHPVPMMMMICSYADGWQGVGTDPLLVVWLLSAAQTVASATTNSQCCRNLASFHFKVGHWVVKLPDSLFIDWVAGKPEEKVCGIKQSCQQKKFLNENWLWGQHLNVPHWPQSVWF